MVFVGVPMAILSFLFYYHSLAICAKYIYTKLTVLTIRNRKKNVPLTVVLLQ